MTMIGRPCGFIIKCVVILASFALCSCVDEDGFSNTNGGNLEALWKIMDEHYCFFDEKKQELGVDWNEIHERYSAQVIDGMRSAQLFELAASMLGELRDGHVNLSSSWDFARNWSWKENYAVNFSDTLLRRYLSTDYRILGSLRYRILNDNIGYIHYGSFETMLGDGNLDEIMYYLAPCNGLIVDMRGNGGGQLTAAETFASRFVNEKTLVGYMRHKTGKNHDDFSAKKAQYLNPANGMRWQKKLVVLTNREVFSAANEFVKYIKAIGHIRKDVVVVGDKTGGGAGMPFTSELPNGWAVRFSACPMYDADGHSTESGIEPDVWLNLTDDDFRNGQDTMIEYARRWINQK